MKKNYGLIAIAIIMAVVASCASAPKRAPSWVSEVPGSEEVWGIGFAKLENDRLALEAATTQAQRDAARQISAVVQGLLTDHANEAGIMNDRRSTLAIENIAKNITDMNLYYAVVNKREQLSDGTWYVRVSAKRTDANGQAANIINNEVADYAEFRKEQALQRLEYELQKAELKPVPLGE